MIDRIERNRYNVQNTCNREYGMLSIKAEERKIIVIERKNQGIYIPRIEDKTLEDVSISILVPLGQRIKANIEKYI